MFATSKFAEGTRLLDPAKDKLWLVFDGACHHVTCEKVYSSLFRSQVLIEKVKSPNFKEGERLIFGTRLVRGPGTTATYLVAVHPRRVRLHQVSDLDKYGFDASLCQSVPLDVLKDIPKGRTLS